jgi:XisH protein
MAKDLIHDAVKHALQKSGWEIVADPFRLVYAEFVLLADLAAVARAQPERGKLIVEVKSFVGRSFVKELQQALGQYVMYRDFLELNQLDYDLYLAVSDISYHDLFRQQAAQVIVQRHQVKLLVVNVEQEEVVQWIA